MIERKRTSPNVVHAKEQYLLKMPKGMRRALDQRAAQTGRSVNTEIVEAIKAHLGQGESYEVRLTKLEEFIRLNTQAWKERIAKERT
jgi:predicted DNA-binding protein